MKRSINNSTIQQLNNSTIPHGYFSYYSALLAVQVLVDKIRVGCQGEPVITGDLAERKNAVKEIEIECTPIIECIPTIAEQSPSCPELVSGSKKGDQGGLEQPATLFPEKTNRVIEILRPRYKDIVPETAGHITEIRFNFMSISTTIHFKH